MYQLIALMAILLTLTSCGPDHGGVTASDYVYWRPFLQHPNNTSDDESYCPLEPGDDEIVDPTPTPTPEPSPTPDPEVTPTPTPTPESTPTPTPSDEGNPYACAPGKSYVCHSPSSGNEITLCVGDSAAAAHVSHGDELGACD